MNEYKQNKIIIIFNKTYFKYVDQIDRIAIIKEEKLYCLGKINFVKEKMGVGYNLKIKKLEECSE